MDKNIARQLVDARAAVRDKIKTLKSNIADSKLQLESTFSPLTEPLKTIASKLQENTIDLSETDGYVKQEEEDDYFKKEISPKKKAMKSFQIKRKKFVAPVSRFNVVKEAMSTPLRSNFEDATTENADEPTEEVFESTVADHDSSDESSEFERNEELQDSNEIDVPESDINLQHIKHAIAEQLKTPEVREALKQFHELPRSYLVQFKLDVVKKEFDRKFGVRDVKGNLYLGNGEVQFDGPDILIDDKKYVGTQGLYELIFKKVPKKFSKQDAQNYLDILLRTNAHHVDYDPNRKVASSKSGKYVTIVKPLLKGQRPNVWWARSWKGAGIIQKKLTPDRKLQYTYWDDPNELVNRLRLLIASYSAGNGSHLNEIISIVEELREAHIIQ